MMCGFEEDRFSAFCAILVNKPRYMRYSVWNQFQYILFGQYLKDSFMSRFNDS